ncbi:MAG TPA: hypothetical protein VGK74_11350 [Symbiobacteriaceae bacterium]|jgi:hypothetical protein
MEGAIGVANIPGRSVSIVGLALMTVAVLLSVLPRFSGIGFSWSVIMLAGGALVAVHELRPGGPPPGGLPALSHPLIPPVFALLAAVHAFQLLRLGLVPLLWAAAAVLLCSAQYRKAMLAPGRFRQFFDPVLAWYGYRRYLVVGAAVCLGSLFFTWGETLGYWTGSLAYDTNGFAWNPFTYYWPGYALSGRNQALALFVELCLVALVVWSAHRGNGPMPAWFNRLAAGMAGFLTLWWLVHIQANAGPWVFLPGLLLIDFAVVMIYRRQHAGPYDLAHLFGRRG